MTELLSEPAGAEHIESNVKIYQSKDYGRFKTITGNRELDEKKIERIKKEIREGIDVLSLCPVIVEEKNGRLNIIDGQHRYYVSKQMKTHVNYVLSKRINLQAIAKINSNTDKWKVKDFVNCYMQQGNKDYETLRQYLETFKLPFGITTSLLTYGRIDGETGTFEIDTTKFQRGGFEVKCEQQAMAFIDKLMKFDSFKNYRQKAFVVAVDTILKADLADFELLVKKYLDNPSKLIKNHSVKEYLQNLQAIYNYKLKEQVAIF